MMKLLLLLLLAILICGCRALPDYEVLTVPKSSAQYFPGKVWLPGVGPTGDPLSQCRTNSGLDELSIDKARSLAGSLNVPLIKWISASLGMGNQKVSHAEWTNLQHVYVLDAYKLATKNPILWETIVTSNLVMTITNASMTGLNANVLASALSKGAVGDITLKATNTAKGGYYLTSDKPLVTAVRIVQPQFDVGVDLKILDLSDRARGRTQQAGLGYRVTVNSAAGSIDALRQKVRLSIDNANMVMFAGTNLTFSGQEGWINSNREAISSSDPKAAKAQFVWDKLNIEWDEHLTNCMLRVTRQYMNIKPSKSGLKGTF